MTNKLNHENSLTHQPKSGYDQALRQILSLLATFLGLAVIYVFFWGLTGYYGIHTFATWNTTQIMLQQSVIVGTAAIGMTLIIITGGIDLSVASIIAMVMVAIAQLIKLGYSPTVAAIAGICVGALCGLLTGVLITRLKLLPFIITLGMMGALRGGAKGLAGQTTVFPDDGVGWIQPLVGKLSKAHAWMIFPPGVWIMLVLAGLMILVLKYTRFGRHVFAVGSNEQTARLCGVRVDLTKTLVYTIGGVFAGVAGLMHVSKLRGGDPTGAMGMELNIIAAVVIGGASLSGGRGGIMGSIIGTFIITVVAIGCTQMGWENWVQEMVTGVIIIIAVLLDRVRVGNASS